jgi:chromosome partitioning protein
MTLKHSMGITISITNQKGGVGKTTTAVNLASSLARRGLRVLLIDFDPQGHATEHLAGRVAGGEGQKSILNVIQKTGTILQNIQPTKEANLFLLPANLRLGLFNQNQPQGRQFVLAESFDSQVHQNFDFIIIDCQPSLSLLTLNALTAADFVLLPVQAEFFALDGLSQLIITLKEVQTKLHPRLNVLGILLTMFDSRNRLSGEVQNELQKNFKKELFQTLIPRNVKLAEAPSFGKSIFEYDNLSTGASAYNQLGEEILTKLKLTNNSN